jgi:hypothetical protein
MPLDRERETAAYLEECYSKFIAGDGRALLEAVALSLACRMPAPEWVIEAFFSIWEDALDGKIARWDEIFGRPWGPGTRKAAAGSFDEIRVWFRVDELAKQGRSITNDLFEEIGNELGLSRSKVSRLYYARNKTLKEIGEI